MQLEDCLKQLEAEHINIARLLIRQGGVTEVTSKHGDGRFRRTAIQLVRFH